MTPQGPTQPTITAKPLQTMLPLAWQTLILSAHTASQRCGSLSDFSALSLPPPDPVAKRNRAAGFDFKPPSTPPDLPFKFLPDEAL